MISESPAPGRFHRHARVSLLILALGGLGAVAAPSRQIQHRVSTAQAAVVTAAAPSETTPDPELRQAPKSILRDAGRPQLIGDHFDDGVTVTLTNAFHEFTFAKRSIIRVSSRLIELDPHWLEEGTYSVSVRNPSGRRSNEMTITVRSK